ncbi:MAG: PLP-dependent aminotransferase family protein [Alphaproteobacteria bacterium]|nr:PLP-dependent aminotransferase family protein [Alphaproteobacteria bacterium]
MTELIDAAPSAWTPDLSEAPGPKYAAIADLLARDVQAGRLKPGDRLPPQRDLAWRLGVTVGTVTRGYREAERRGLVAGEVGRGTFVRARSDRLRPLFDRGGAGDGPGLPWSAGDPVMEESPSAPEQGPIALQSNILTPGSEAHLLRRTLAEMAADDTSATEELLSYQPRQAASRFRRAGISWLARRGLEAVEGDVAVSAGAHNGLMSTFAAILKPGQRVLTEALTYPGVKTIAKLLDLELVPGALDAEGLTVEAVADAAAAGRIDAVYTVPTLQNPTTATMSEQRRRDIAAVCERFEIPIVEDDICGLFPPDAPAPLVRYAPSTGYYVTSLSKTLAAGLRIGFVKTPPRMRDVVAASIRACTWMASPITAEIATRWIESGGADAVLAERRAVLESRAQRAREVLDGFSFRLPPGGLHLWLDLPRPWRASQFVAAAAARDVLLTAAHAFTVGDAPLPPAVRVCLGGPASDERLAEGLERLRRILEDVDPLSDSEVM